MSNSNLTSIVVVSYNSEATISKLLTSLRKHLTKDAYEVLVVDNHSQDNTVHEVKKHTWVKCIENSSNQGFARACHIGVEASKGIFLFFINPDVVIEDNILRQTLSYFKDHTVGIVGTKIKNIDGSIQHSVRSFPTLSSQIPILLKVHHLFPMLPSLKSYFKVGFNFEKESDVDQVMGAAFLTTRKLWDTIGGFDKRFFIWFEEVDYCLQAKLLGYRTVYTPKTCVVHIGGYSFSQISFLKKQIWFFSSMFKYFMKNGL